MKILLRIAGWMAVVFGCVLLLGGITVITKRDLSDLHQRNLAIGGIVAPLLFLLVGTIFIRLSKPKKNPQAASASVPIPRENA